MASTSKRHAAFSMWRARRNWPAMRERLRRFSQFTASSGVSGAGRADVCDEDVAVAAQVPVGVGFAADTDLARAILGGGARGVRWRVFGRRCAETFAGGEINYREHETR